MKEADWWIERMDELKASLELTDVALGRLLDISGVMIGHVRAGRSALPVLSKVKLLDRLGFAFTRESLLLLLAPEVREAVRAADKHRAAERREGKKYRRPRIPDTFA
jgi:hypothetical protein